MAILDLDKAYLQLHVDEPLWPFQTVMMRDPQYCLKRLSFGLNIPPLAIRAVKTILTKEPEIAHTLMICFVNEDVVSAKWVTAFHCFRVRV